MVEHGEKVICKQLPCGAEAGEVFYANISRKLVMVRVAA